MGERPLAPQTHGDSVRMLAHLTSAEKELIEPLVKKSEAEKAKTWVGILG